MEIKFLSDCIKQEAWCGDNVVGAMGIWVRGAGATGRTVTSLTHLPRPWELVDPPF